MSETDRLNEMAAALAATIIRPGDHRNLLVSFTFIAQRDETGVMLSDLMLGYDASPKQHIHLGPVHLPTPSPQ